MKKVLASICAMSMALSVAAVPAFAGNTADTSFFVRTGTDAIITTDMEMRAKKDASSAYLWVKSGTDALCSLDCRGHRSYEDVVGEWCNDGFSQRHVATGSRYFIYNDVYEKGMPLMTLDVTPDLGKYVTGVWSPDSVWESGVTQI